MSTANSQPPEPAAHSVNRSAQANRHAAEPSLPKALFWLGLTFIGFPGINATIREITQHLHPFEVVFWRNLFAVSILLPVMLGIHGRDALRLNRPKPIILRGVIEFLCMCMIFMALKGLPLAEATALTFTMPIWITAGAALFMGETVRLRRWLATLAGFGGMLVIVRPGFGEFTIYTAAALGTAILAAASSLLLRSAGKSDPPGKIIMWMSLVVTPLGLMAALPYWQGLTWELAALVLLAVAFGTLGHYGLTQAYRYGETSQLSPYRYGELVVAAVIGFVIFGELPSIYTYIGGAIIAASGIYIAHREHVAAKRSQQQASEALMTRKL
jgi:drug/metabolite transporter (DMT)-like permease